MENKAWNKYDLLGPILFVSRVKLQYDESVSFLLRLLSKNFFFNLDPSFSVCIVLVPSGAFPQRINGKAVKLAVLSCFIDFFLFDFIHTSDYTHFTFSDTI